MLEDEADVALLRRQRCRVDIGDLIDPIGLLQPGDDAKQRRLPPPLGPSKAVNDPVGMSTETLSSATKSPKRS